VDRYRDDGGDRHHEHDNGRHRGWDDHHEQRRLFAILEQIDPANVRALDDIWARLAVLLEVHAAAEEAIFYPELVKLAVGPQPLSSAEPETIDAIHDHNEIRDAIGAVTGHQVGSQGWRDAVTAANLANSDHMANAEIVSQLLFEGADLGPEDEDASIDHALDPLADRLPQRRQRTLGVK